MKKKYRVLFLINVGVVLFSTQLASNPTGTPQPAAGAPAESSATCCQPGCHTGSAVPANDIITTDIPAAGYDPGSMYNITVTVKGVGQKGFMVSPQNETGTYLGTLFPGPGSKAAFTKYITHSTSKAANSAVWTFQWKAPAKGTGPVGFYGAFAISRNNTKQQLMTVQENQNTGIAALEEEIAFTVYPNPAKEQINVSFDGDQPAAVQVSLAGLDGKMVYPAFHAHAENSKQELNIPVTGMDDGIYVLQLQAKDRTYYRKIMISR